MAMCLPAAFIGLVLVAAPDPSDLGKSGDNGDKELCKRNLRLVYDAIQAYRQANKDLPDSLSELFPKYLADPNLLICPTAKKRGLTSIAATGRQGFSDPRTSYFYEFSKVPVQDAPGRSNRDWKSAQMGLLGSVVPIARCLVHDRPINLSFGGDVYETDKLEWEYKFTNVVDLTHLSPEYLLAPTNTVRVIEIRPRDPAATAGQVDLSDFYNASLTRAWVAREPTHNLASLPTGLRELNGIRFDIRGVIQFSSPALAQLGESFPGHVTIPLALSCQQLHFLVGTSLAEKEGTQAGRFDIRFADGQTEAIALRMGRELGATWTSSKNAARPTSAGLAWQAQPPNTGELFELTWTNSRPAVSLRYLDCNGGMNTQDFFLVAISATP